MIPKSFDMISYDDLQALLDNAVPESKTLEYKRDLPDNSDRGRNSFLAAVASFANTDGGDLIYGIEAQDGIPETIFGVGEVIADQLQLRLESTIRSSIEPRLPKCEMKVIHAPSREVLLVRVTKSWAAPHRVTLGRESGPFYARHSTGKYEMDVAELRTAFALSDTIGNRIEAFHNDRVGRIFNHHTPIQIHSGCKLAVHIVPLSAFASREQIDIQRHIHLLRQFIPIGRTTQQHSRINLEGVINFANLNDVGRSGAYTQVFRSGILEAVTVFTERDGVNHLYSTYEQSVIRSVQVYMVNLGQLEIVSPFYVFLSLIDLTGVEFIATRGGIGDEARQADRKIISLPEIVVTDTTLPVHMLLKPAFDMVWNAFGYPGSRHYDTQGNWNENA